MACQMKRRSEAAKRPCSAPALAARADSRLLPGGFGGRGYDRPLVDLQRLEPAFQVCGGIVARIVGRSKIGAEE